jgi:HemX protein
MLTHLLLGLALLAYGSAFLAYLVLFVAQNPDARRLSRPLLMGAMALHLLCLLSIWLVRGHFPLGQAGEALLTSVLSFFVIYLAVEIRTDQPNLGVFVLGAGLLLLVVGSARLEDQPRHPELLTAGSVVHVVVNILGYSGLILGAIASGLFLLLLHEIRAKHLGAIYQRLPPLETLDRMGFHATALGFALLTAGMALGVLFVFRRHVGTALAADPKLVATAAVWLLNGFYLAARLVLGWKRRKTAWISVAAFAALVFSITVAPFIRGGFHDF